MAKATERLLIDIFGWAFLVPSVFKTIFITKYLRPPYLEAIDYRLYPAFYEKLAITAKVWVIPSIAVIVSPIFILIGMGIIFRQKWSRILLIVICSVELSFVSAVFIISSLFNPVWIAKNLGAPYYDEALWYIVIPILCILIFTRPRVKDDFGRNIAE